MLSGTFLHADGAEDRPVPIFANIKFLQQNGLRTLQVSLQSGLSQTLCIGDGAFSAVGTGSLAIWNEQGRSIAPSVVGYPRVEEFHDVDYAQRYHFLFPGKSIDHDIDLKFYPFQQKATYVYEWTARYYVCRDIVDSDRIGAPSTVRLHSKKFTGRFTVPAR